MSIISFKQVFLTLRKEVANILTAHCEHDNAPLKRTKVFLIKPRAVNEKIDVSKEYYVRYKTLRIGRSLKQCYTRYSTFNS